MRNWHFSRFYFFYFATVGVIVPYWSVYLSHRGFDATEIGQLMAILLLTKVVAPNIWATVADNLVATKGSSLGMLKFATFATLLIYSFTYITQGFWSMAAVMLCFCMFWNACLPQLEAATLNHLKDDKGKYGLIRLWGSVGFIFTVLGLGWLMDYAGPAAVMPAGAIALLSVFVVSFSMRGDSSKSPQVSVKVPVSQLLSNQVLILLSLCIFMQISHAPFYTFFSIYLESYGYSKLHIGWLWSVGVICEIIVFLIALPLLRRFSLTSLFSFTLLVAAARWLLVARYPDVPVLIWFSQALHAVTYGLYHTVMIHMIDSLFQGRYQIRGQALYSSVTFGLGGAIGSFLSGYIWTVYGSRVLFIAASTLMFLVFLVSLLFVRRLDSQASHKGHS